MHLAELAVARRRPVFHPRCSHASACARACVAQTVAVDVAQVPLLARLDAPMAASALNEPRGDLRGENSALGAMCCPSREAHDALSLHSREPDEPQASPHRCCQSGRTWDRTREKSHLAPTSAIRKRMADAQRTMQEIEAQDAREIVAAGKADEKLAEAKRALSVIEAGKTELAARRREAVIPNMEVARGWRERQDERDARRKVRQPIVDALKRVATFSHLELKAEKLDPSRLSDEEGAELKSS